METLCELFIATVYKLCSFVDSVISLGGERKNPPFRSYWDKFRACNIAINHSFKNWSLKQRFYWKKCDFHQIDVTFTKLMGR